MSLSLRQLDSLFPFGMLVASSGRIEWAGRSLVKLLQQDPRGLAFADSFEIVAPDPAFVRDDLSKIRDDILVIRPRASTNSFRLRGQCLANGEDSLLALSLVLTDLEKIGQLRLDFSDFSLSDPIFDLLLLVQTERRAVRELRQANAREKQAIAKLAMASRLSSLGEMSAGIAHEINNPLAIIQMACEQFLDAPDMPSERAVAIIRRAQNATLRISKIVSGLRTYARDGSLDDVVTTDVRKVVEDTLVLCESRFRIHGIDLQVRLPEDCGEIECNVVQISQILMNLLSNSFDSVDGTANPWVRLEVDGELDSERIRFIVSDSGAIIPDEVAERLMQPFFTTKPVGRGTGLGLPISLGIAEAHQGSLALDQSSGCPTFVLELPRRQMK